ncbi:S10 family peptidase [Tropicimonas sp. IMCC6043]|uniref:S10 family peptidase n=1 Tax=Tropicimonas sp. IMCC6043 TaxID=2510645 RepID=UPI00101E037E|nr:carboxypeptidase [Tropicimonas sp. IMCC6043]RYH06640.1 carboxypeptidase [Tropicimonas sp. IMCC6043]
MIFSRYLHLTFLILLLSCGIAIAQRSPDERAAGERTIFDLLPPDSTTQHVWDSATGPLAYTATAGTIDLFDSEGELSAKMYYTAYRAEDATGARPITFAFNGGPGAASAYLHMGLAGPQIAELGKEGGYGATPDLRENPDSWLAFTDLVFIDPVGTGWSRAVSDEATREFYGVEQDAGSLARAISIFVQQNGLLSAPKFLLGESYGGFRAAKVATELRERHGIVLSGIVMVSPFLEGRYLSSSSHDPLSAALQLPSLAAAEMERQGTFSETALAEAEAFAMKDYLVALVDPAPPGAVANSFHERVSDLTGIPAADVARARGYVGALYASRSAEDGDAVSRYDAAHAFPNPYPASGYPWAADPVLDGYTRAYGAAFASYARRTLGFDGNMTYELLNDSVSRRWDWDGARSRASSSSDLVDMLTVSPGFRMLILHGYSDAVTPYRVSEYLIDQLPRDLTGERVILRNYRGGHMFYIDPASRRAAAADAERFFRDFGS